MIKFKAKLTLVLIFILIICSIYFIKNKNSDVTVVKTFLEQYYTVDEIKTSEYYNNEEYISQKMDHYKEFIDISFYEKFLNDRLVTRNMKWAEDNQCTLSIKKVKLEPIDKSADEVDNYKFYATLIAKYKNTNSSKSVDVSGYIQTIKNENNYYINYVELPNLNKSFN